MVLKVFRGGKSEYENERAITAWILKKLEDELRDKEETYYAFVQVRLFCDNCKVPTLSSDKWRDLDILVVSQESMSILELKNFRHEKWQRLSVKIFARAEDSRVEKPPFIMDDEWYVESEDGGFRKTMSYVERGGKKRPVHSWKQTNRHYRLTKDVLREYFSSMELKKVGEGDLSEYLNGYIVIPNESRYIIELAPDKEYNEQDYMNIREYVDREVKRRITHMDESIDKILLTTIKNRNPLSKILSNEDEFEKFVEFLKDKMGMPTAHTTKGPDKSAIVEVKDVYRWYLTTIKKEEGDIKAEVYYIKDMLNKLSNSLDRIEDFLKDYKDMCEGDPE